MDEVLLYILRVWRGRTTFRASLRSAGDEQARYFDSAGELTRFIGESARGPGVAPAAPVDPGGPEATPAASAASAPCATSASPAAAPRGPATRARSG